jgi:hypothetical protein
MVVARAFCFLRSTEVTARYIPLVVLAMGMCGSRWASGQPVSFGMIGGASLLADFQNRMVGDLAVYSTPRGAIGGGLLDIRLHLALSIEIDGLYHELEFTNAVMGPNGALISVSQSPVGSWEFPVLAKYRFTLALLKPFVELGPTFRSAQNRNGTSPSNYGIAIGAGAEAFVWKLRIAPVVRYLRWARDQDVGPVAPSTAPDQVELLLGVSF